MEIFGETAVFPGGYGRIGVYRVKLRKLCAIFYVGIWDSLHIADTRMKIG